MDASKINVGDTERLASAAVGLLLALKGLRRRSLLGGALAGAGAALLHRGVTGRCAVYRTADVSTAGKLSIDQEHTFVRTLLVNCPPGELLDLARGGMNRLLGTDEPVHILSASSDEAFSFTSGRHWGKVWVKSDPRGQASRLGVAISFFSGDGLVEKPLDRLGRPFWEHYLMEGLRQFKAWVETGEVATTEGQTHGERSAISGALLATVKSMQARPGGLSAPRQSLPHPELRARALLERLTPGHGAQQQEGAR